MPSRLMQHVEEDETKFSADAYRVIGDNGCAWRVLGWETEPNEDTEWSGIEERTGRVAVVMVGDDRKFFVDEEDLQPISDEEYCGSCGQIGCGCFVSE